MSNDDAAIERDIQAAGKTAPRVTPDAIEDAITGEFYTTLGEAFKGCPIPTTSFSTFKLCVLTLRNGFIVTGESACASPENFDRNIGEKIAREKAREKIWLLEGYALRERLAREEAERRGADDAVRAS